MTTETTSLTLHERLESRAHLCRKGPVTTSYNAIPNEDVAAIEAAIRDEATASLNKRIKDLEDLLAESYKYGRSLMEALADRDKHRSMSLHECLRIAAPVTIYSEQDGLSRWDYCGIPEVVTAQIEADLLAPLREEIERLTESAEGAYTASKFAFGVIDRTQAKYDSLRAENAALRQAGDALRDAVFGAASGINYLNPLLATLDKAVGDYDAATTPRAQGRKEYGWPIYTNAAGLPEISVVCENCHKSQYYWPLNDAGELELSPSEIGCECPPRAEETPKAPGFEALVEAWKDDEVSPPIYAMPPSPTDAAGEGDTQQWMLWREDTEDWRGLVNERLATLEQRADEVHKVIDTLQVWGVDLQKRLAALEARPQPVAVVSEAVVNAYWLAAYGDPIGPICSREEVRAGLTAALAAKEAGE